MEVSLAEVRALFDPAPGTIYLDSATYGLPPRPTLEAMQQALRAWQTGTADWVRDWDTRGETCREAFAKLIGVGPETIALLPSASVGVGTIAASLTANDNIVVPDDEFTSLLFPLLVAARERGATVKLVPLDQLAQSVEPRTTLVAFSLVQSHSGLSADLDSTIDAAQRVGARTLVDATHAIPFVPVSEEIDYLVCAAYKHLLSPRGVAFMYVNPKHWDDLVPWLANWRSAREPYGRYYGPPLDLATGAARFDVSLAWFSWVGAAVSLDLLRRWDQQGLLAEPVRLARRLAEKLGVPRPVGSVVSIPVGDAEQARADLAAAGIKGAVRAGSVRLSPHVYNTVDEVDQAASILRRYVAHGIISSDTVDTSNRASAASGRA
jgi:selenocysteine lyase/cysteine desulfurase